MAQADDGRHLGFGYPIHLEEGVCYLATGKSAEPTYRLVQHLAEDGVQVLCVSRIHPDRIRAKYGFGNVKTWWISTSPGEDNFDPTAIGTLANAIQEFVDQHPDGCLVLLDGLEYITINVGFDKTLLFMEHLNEFVMPRRASLLIPVSPECFEPTEYARLERFTEAIEQTDLRDALEVDDANRASPMI